MKKVNELLTQYNSPNNYLVISEFPSLKQLKGNTGLSRYSQNTIFSLQKTAAKEKRRAIVLANILADGKEEIYEYHETLIIRCIKRNNMSSLLRLIKYAFQLARVKTVLFEFEFAAYGSEKMSLAIPFVLAVFTLLGKKTHFALHQVVSDLQSLYIHLGLRKGSFRLKVIEKALQVFYSLVGLLSHKVLVLEEEFKDRLSNLVRADKIDVIPHGIEKMNLNQSYAKQDLGYDKADFVILLFGYVTWYKGVEDLIEAFNKLPSTIQGRKVKLLIAGGRSVAQKGKKHYEEYYNKIEKLASASQNIVLSGFVKESEIEKYYAVADLCVVPYKTFMSSSGPLSLAISFQKPVMLSNHLQGYIKSVDFAEAVSKAGLAKKDLFMPITSAALQQAVKKTIINKSYRVSIKEFAQRLLQSRDWIALSKSYADVLFSAQNNDKKGSYIGVLTFYRLYDIISKQLKFR